ncbi:MAG TPA: hypothetical protein VLH13_03065 [Methanomassiliicoccales archaeon]|nr:hypothetical protein [Methanomassiliicoccales archaeon]
MLSWSILGKKSLPIRFDHDLETRLRELAARKKDAVRFLKMLDQAEITYTLHAVLEVHAFTFRFEPSTSKEDFQWFEKYVENMLKSVKEPILSLEGEAQKSVLVITADEDVNNYGKRIDPDAGSEEVVTQEIMQKIPVPKKAAPKKAVKGPASKKTVKPAP